MAKCSDAMHARAMDALHSLSGTQFGRAALERHGHQPVPVETARAYKPSTMTSDAAKIDGGKDA